MKKFLLSAVAIFAAMSVNAQVFKVSAEANGIGSDAVDVEAGKAWGSIEGVIDVSNPFATQHKSVDCKNNGFNKVIIDGNEIETKDGVQGQDNPKDADGGNPAMTFKEPVSGAVIQIDAKKNGWVYIVAKLSTNKQYIVFEEGAPIGYKIAMENADERVKDGVLNLEIKGTGEFNNLVFGEGYEEGVGVKWVIREYLNDPEATTAGNGLGVFYFPVAEGCKYYAHATGSKISWTGIYFSENEASKVEVVGETEDGAAISKVLVNTGGVEPTPAGNGDAFKVSAEANGIGSDAVDVEAGKVWGAIDGTIDIFNPFATQHKSVDCKNNGFNKVIIDGTEIETKDGVQGQDNPKDADGGNPAITFKEPVSGAVIQIDAKKNGWIYVVAKLSTNKQYMVFEEGAPIGYKIAMENTDERVKDGVLNLEIKGTGEYNNLVFGEGYEEGVGVKWVIREYLNDPEAATAGNGLGVFYFPVAEGCKYYAHATGSKISWTGIYFSESEASKVEVVGETEDGAPISKVLVNGSASGIQTVKNTINTNGAIYNLAGQKVDSNFKGIVIKNGKKMIQK